MTRRHRRQTGAVVVVCHYAAAVRSLSHLLFALLAGLVLAVVGSTTLGSFRLVGQPFAGLSLVEEGLVNPVGLSSWGGGRAGFRMWDRIVAVDGELVFSKDDIVARALSRPLGETVVYQVQGLEGSQRFVELATRIFTPSDLVRSHTMHAALGLIFVLIAVLLYTLRPGTAEAWAFFVFFAALGTVMASVVDMTLLWRLPPLFSFVAPWLGWLGFLLVVVITRAWVKTEGARLLESRPEPGEPGFVDKPGRERVQRRMIAAVVVGAGVSGTISLLMLGGIVDQYTRYTVVEGLLYGWIAFCALCCLMLLALAYQRGRSPRRRARIRQILWAWPVGAGIPVINLFCGQVLQLWPVSQIWNAFLLLVPFASADAIVRHDLLRLNHTARRLVGGLTVAAAVGVVLGFVLWAAVAFLKLDDASAMVALAAVLFAVAAPMTHRVQSYIEGLLRQTSYDPGRLSSSFTAKASTSNRLDDVVAEFMQVTRRSIRPVFIEVWRLDATAESLDGAPRLVPLLSSRAPIVVDQAVLAFLDKSEPQVCDDEQPAPVAVNDAAGETSIVVRLAVAGETVGLLVVGERSDGRPYEGTDVAFVGSLAGPLAAALVSTLAFEAVERLNRDLEMRVQTRTAELALKNDELALLNQRKDDLVNSVSHDFRSPLAIIRQNVQTVLLDLHNIDNADLKMFLEAIARQEARLTSMCTNLLDLARLKQKETLRDAVDLRVLCCMIVDTFSTRASSKGVTVILDVDTAFAPVIAGDGDRLGQVVQNLVDNALKFTPTGGSITLSLTGNGHHEVVLVVKDTGCGVPAEALPRLFEPFFQVPLQSHVGQGSGLGLAIVKAVVEAHRGRIDVSSDDSAGTTFTVVLPLAPPTIQAAA